MKRLALLLVLAGCGGCEQKNAPPAEPPPSLRVPLPDGWRATTFSGGLQVGPQGRVVLQLESTSKPLPSAEAFVAAIQSEGFEIIEKESVDTFIGVRYSMSADSGKRDAFLGVRKTGPRTIWCSTTASAHSDEVEAAMTVCRSLSWEG
jgi:hypothetical protein